MKCHVSNEVCNDYNNYGMCILSGLTGMHLVIAKQPLSQVVKKHLEYCPGVCQIASSVN